MDATDIEVIVFDVLGTMVDEPSGLRAAIRDAVNAIDDVAVDQLLTVWLGHVESEQQRVRNGSRAYADTHVIDREAARRVADQAGLVDPATVEELATASQRLDPWPDSSAGLARVAQHFPVVGLSNASRATLLRLNAHAGLSWHQVVSAADVRAYKPAPEVYQRALDAAGCPPERVLMVAAHAWDLRGAQAAGMSTAFVRRPVGDPPTPADTFDWSVNSLDELVTALTA